MHQTKQLNNIMNEQTRLLLDYQEMAIIALREEVDRLRQQNELLIFKLQENELDKKNLN